MTAQDGPNPRLRLARCAGLAVALLALAGCATLPPVTPAPSGPAWNERAARLPAGGWVASGRFAVATAIAGRLDGGGGQGTFRWVRTGRGSEVEVAGPLGLGQWRLRLEESVVVLERAGERLTVTDPEVELQALLGFPLPVLRLDAWLRGLPAPAPATAPSPGTVGFRQDGWEIEYSGFDDLGRPTGLRAARPGLRVRAVIERWEELPDTALAPP
jgi:outer membrane lipoprotein LolB